MLIFCVLLSGTDIREVEGSKLSPVGCCAHNKILSYAPSKLNCPVCCSRAIDPTLVGLCLFDKNNHEYCNQVNKVVLETKSVQLLFPYGPFVLALV